MAKRSKNDIIKEYLRIPMPSEEERKRRRLMVPLKPFPGIRDYQPVGRKTFLCELLSDEEVKMDNPQYKLSIQIVAGDRQSFLEGFKILLDEALPDEFPETGLSIGYNGDVKECKKVENRFLEDAADFSCKRKGE
jgi:hypothetical protein